MASTNTSTGASTASLRLALWQSRRLRLVLAGIVLLVIAFLVFAFVLLQPGSTPPPNRFDAAALRYANGQIVWNNTPSVQSTQVVPLDRLSATLRRAVRPTVAAHIDPGIPGLIQQFGRTHKVALVVLTGSYNTLPPDEGVNTNGQIVVLVDTIDTRGIYLNY